ncbi:MAG TPA: aldehyde dehydrogenase [Paraburkholderia sp.]|uniref:aldehyde dehydrogenase n=1 Tax=Paraburkholderia sp. TaxID=1926495 RepID=UPI002ED576C0
MSEKYRLFINNEWVEPRSGKWFETLDPFSGEPWALIPQANAEDVDAAVRAADAAMRGPWGTMSASDRGMLMHRLGALIEQNAARLSEVESKDNGKLQSEVSGQVRYVARYFYYYGGLADKIQSAVIPMDKPKVFNYTRYEPIGVVGTITPWNSSLLLTAWKLAPALAAGNTVVAKPSEFTSASLLELAKLFVEAGFPPGVFNVITGFGQEAGEPLVVHPLVPRIAFTGGDEGGRKVNELGARHFKRVSLELGGKSPNIVFDDADLTKAANGVITGIFSAGGQTCMAGSRLLLQESIHDEFVERLLAITSKAKVGNPALPGIQVGPVATRPQFEKVMRYINIAKEEGARCIAGGRAPQGPEYGCGQIVEPTIFVDVENSMRIAQEEVFGPVLAVLKFKDEEDALRIGNDIRFGLAAGVWTQSLKRAMLMSERLRAGTVWVNNYRSTSYTTPFGGFKDSGIGREGGVEAVKEYLETKSVWISTDLDMPDPFVRKY